MNPSAIQSAQLNRLAVVYVRQSTPLQVEHHPESRLGQYQLTDRARAFGWLPQRCLVIDDDLGISGAQSSNRPGYQRLVSMLARRSTLPTSIDPHMRRLLRQPSPATQAIHDLCRYSARDRWANAVIGQPWRDPSCSSGC